MRLGTFYRKFCDITVPFASGIGEQDYHGFQVKEEENSEYFPNGHFLDQYFFVAHSLGHHK